MGLWHGLEAVTSKCCHLITKRIINNELGRGSIGDCVNSWVLRQEFRHQLYTKGYPGPKFATSSFFRRMNIRSQIRVFKGSVPVFEVFQDSSQISVLMSSRHFFFSVISASLPSGTGCFHSRRELCCPSPVRSKRYIHFFNLTLFHCH